MDIVNACAERESLGGNSYRNIHHIKPIAFLQDGSYVRSNHNWVNGDATFRHVVTAAPMLVYTASDGMRRIAPTREPDRYIEIGAPLVKVGGIWTKPNFGAATRVGNRLTWHNVNADMSVTMAGHYIKADIALLGGYIPADRQFAFPVGMSGLTRDGGRILRDGVEVMHLRAPDVYDAAAPEAERLPIAHEFVSVGGQPYILFTLPSGVEAMSAPVVDPTFEVQPDAAAGKDNFILPPIPDTNLATDTGLGIGTSTAEWNNNRALIAISASIIPAGSTASSATLTITNKADGAQTATVTVEARGILSGNSSWTESGSTWNKRDTTNNWAGSAGCSTSATDFDSDLWGSVGVTDAALGTQYGLSLSTSKVSDWFGDDTTNYGLRLASDDETTNGKFCALCSSDHATEAYRPMLTIEYTEAGGHPTMRRWGGIPHMTPGPRQIGRGW